MPVITVREIICKVEEFETMLSVHYKKIADNTQKEGVRLLSEYMARHRIRIHEALDKLDLDIDSPILNTTLRYQPKAADCTCFEKIKLPDNPTAKDLLNEAIQFDDCLVNLYKQVLSQSIPSEVEIIFNSLVQAERRDQIELHKIIATDYF